MAVSICFSASLGLTVDVRLEKIASFNKLKAITQDMKVIVDALEKSQSLKLNSDRSAVRRVTPVGTVAQIVSRSIYAVDLSSFAERLAGGHNH